MRNWIKIAALATLSLSATAAGALIYQVPAIGAYLCPGCYGLQKIAPSIYVDQETADVIPMADNARAIVAAYFGKPVPMPNLLVCTTDACNAKLGGHPDGPLAMVYGSSFFHVSPKGVSETIFVHEFTHTLVHSWIGNKLTGNAAIPAWFDEGLAVLVSNDPRYVRTCGPVDLTTLPTGVRDWRRQAGTNHATMYHDAYCAVENWLDKNGGQAGLIALFDGIKAGTAKF